jgi:hypothetical protein
MRLPGCDTLFMRFFDRWYGDADRARKGLRATRPDMLREETFVGRQPDDIQTLDAASTAKSLKQVRAIFAAARTDWKASLGVTAPVSMAWVDAFDRHYDAKRVATVIRSSDRADFANEYLVLCCELGAVLGEVMLRRNRRLAWLLEWPYWESAVFDSKTGHVIPVFHWAIKKMSGYGVEDGLAAKLECCLGILDGRENARS